MKRLSIFVFLLLFLFNSSGQLTGDWHSSFVVMGMSTRVTLSIEKDSSIFLSSPDDEFPKAEMSKASIVNDSIFFRWSALNLKFEGYYFTSGDSIVANMQQAGIDWTAIFTRDLKPKHILQRAQKVNTDDVFYFSEDVEVTNGDIILGATLTLPQGHDENTPIVILASGSGPQNRNCELMGHEPFLVIADHFAENGIGCMRFDDRGVEVSGGEFAKATLSDFASDINACFAYLKEKGYTNNPIGVAGHSEGGMHALIAASKNKELAFVIELASVGTTGREILIEQQYLIPIQNGKSEEYARFNEKAFSDACSIISEVGPDKAGDSLSSYLGNLYEDAPNDYKQETNKFVFIMSFNSFLNNEWGREFLSYEAAAYLHILKVPLLSVNGSRDIQVPGNSNYDAFRNFKYRSKAKKKNKYVLAEGLNHLMQRCTSCTIEEYGEIEETFSIDVLNMMTDWIKSL